MNLKNKNRFLDNFFKIKKINENKKNKKRRFEL